MIIINFELRYDSNQCNFELRYNKVKIQFSTKMTSVDSVLYVVGLDVGSFRYSIVKYGK